MEPTIEVREMSDGKYVIMREIVQVFNYVCASKYDAEMVAEKLRKDELKTNPGGNWKNVKDWDNLKYVRSELAKLNSWFVVGEF